MSTNYVTNTGFNKKTLLVIKAELEEQYKAAYGEDIDLDPDGPFGLQIGIDAKNLADQWDGLEEIYTARDPQQATGSSLDYISSENGIKRLDATPTVSQNTLLEGTEGTLVAAGKQAGPDDESGITYSLETDTTITEAVAREIDLKPDAPTGAGESYIVGIDSVNYTYVTAAPDTLGDVIDGLKALIDAGAWAGDTFNVGDEFLRLQDIDTDFALTAKTKTPVEVLKSGGVFISDVDGKIALPANNLTQIITPVSGWDGVNNPEPGTIGRDEETDDELRIRRANVFLSGNATEPAIRSKLLQEVDGVTAASVVSNRTLVTDGDGRPPKSFECIVSGGLEADIALQIWNTQPAGIESYGNITSIVTDDQGTDQTIKWSRSEGVYIWVKIQRAFNLEEDYPETGDAQIKSNIVNWSLIPANIDVGVDVIRQRLGTPVYEVPGIGDIKIFLGSTASEGAPQPALAEVNIPISVRQLAIFDVNRIIVEDLP